MPKDMEMIPKIPMTGMQIVPSLLIAFIPKAAVAVNNTTQIRLMGRKGIWGMVALIAPAISPASTAVQPSREKAMIQPITLEPCLP